MTDRRVTVVTGGALGIGGAISRRFAADGDHVLLVDIDAEAAAATASEIEAAEGQVKVIVGDASADETVAEVAAAVARLGRIDVLVNNVGDFRPASKTFLHSKPEQWQRLYEVNLLHVIKMTHALLPTMVEQGSGASINNSTVEAFRGIPGHVVYSAYNAGVSALTKSLAVEVGRPRVRGNPHAPALCDTPPPTPAGPPPFKCGPSNRENIDKLTATVSHPRRYASLIT